MKYAIIAAGEGSRLAKEGVKEPKPLVKINNEVLIDRLINVFLHNNATEVVVICNEEMEEVNTHLKAIAKNGLNGKHIPLRIIRKSTASSMHSFYELSSYLANSPFVLTTVDTIFREAEFAEYVAAFHKAIDKGEDALMGVTDYIDDEKPLYVGIDEMLNVTGFYDTNEAQCTYISGGIYGLTPNTLATLNRCIEKGESRMRNFQRALLADEWKVKAYPFSKVLDIDHIGDIAKAEAFVKATD